MSDVRKNASEAKRRHLKRHPKNIGWATRRSGRKGHAKKKAGAGNPLD